jgi:hypothetical protein
MGRNRIVEPGLLGDHRSYPLVAAASVIGSVPPGHASPVAAPVAMVGLDP